MSKIFAMYLPQYHSIPENDAFWGKDFTDWVSVKKSSPLYKGHAQPNVPLNERYYDLSNVDDVRWQAKLARENGISGFGIYHYWFNNDKNLLTKPAEIIRDTIDIDINYFFAWDNISWKRTWSKIKGNDWSPLNDEKKNPNEPQVLIEHILGSESDWEKHFNWLLPFFKDARYEKKDGKPVFMIYHYEENIGKMIEYWNELAIKNGFNGIYSIIRYDRLVSYPEKQPVFFYEPIFSGWNSFMDRVFNKLKNKLKIKKLMVYDYDNIWNKIIKNAKNNKNDYAYFGAFVNYDDTPRRGIRGKVVKNSSPEKFKKYLKQLIDISNEKNKDYIFLTAWNEWGEGAFLEPSENDKDLYLKVIKDLCGDKNE